MRFTVPSIGHSCNPETSITIEAAGFPTSTSIWTGSPDMSRADGPLCQLSSSLSALLRPAPPGSARLRPAALLLPRLRGAAARCQRRAARAAHARPGLATAQSELSTGFFGPTLPCDPATSVSAASGWSRRKGKAKARWPRKSLGSSPGGPAPIRSPPQARRWHRAEQPPPTEDQRLWTSSKLFSGTNSCWNNCSGCITRLSGTENITTPRVS